ncbi:MAG TPA: DNA polymerase III subunit delta, partial [Burkholderiaceae bacterium]|nr:DNA polymerase III subunit delta [Burkholderiaceae bacterium]
MQVRNDALAGLLARAQRAGSLPPIFVVASDEALLSLEAQDAIRSTARGLGYSERDVLNADARFDWSKLAESAQALSLFAEKKIVEVRLPSGKPGVAGAKALETHASNAIDGVTTIISLPRLERRDRQARWVEALERAGVMVDIDTVERAQLPQWISQRLARQNQSAGRDALEFIADKVEGNLLAAHQEVQKLALLLPAGELAIEDVQAAVSNVARYDVQALAEALLSGDIARYARVLEGLRGEGEAPTFVLWAVAEE